MSQHALRSEVVRLAKEAARTSLAPPRKGLVSAYDPNTYTAKVKVQPEDTESGWLPILTPWAGNGWGLFSPPTVGDQVDVIFQEGDAQSGVILGGVFSDVDRPLPTPSGEFWAVHQSGSTLRFLNDGTVTLHGQTALNLTAPVINLN